MVFEPSQSGRSRLIRTPLALVSLVGLLAGGLVVGHAGHALANGCELTGVGDASSPYLVAVAADLAKVGVGSCLLGAHYQQTGNITLAAPAAGQSNHMPIGADQTRFTGTFDGGGKTITGLVVVGDARVGLFGATGAATLRDIHLVNVSVKGATAGQGDRLGSIVGHMTLGSLADSSVSGTIDIIGKRSLGGLVGNSSGSILRSELTGVFRIEGLEGASGGIVGELQEASMTDVAVHATGPSSIKNTENSAGGIAGIKAGNDNDPTLAPLSNSSVAGELTITGGNAAGGLLGQAVRATTNRSTVGAGVIVLGTGAARVGGLVGATFNETITDSFSLASADAPGRVGGFVGLLGGGSINNSYAAGEVRGGNPQKGFAAVIEDSGAINNSFWDTQTSLQQDSIGGTGKTTAEMKSISTFNDITTVGLAAAWSIVDAYEASAPPTKVWGICEGGQFNGGYPYLLWQASSDPCVVAAANTGDGQIGATSSPRIHLDLQAQSGDLVSGAPLLIEGQGLKPGSAYSLVVRSTPVTVTTGTVSSGGRFSNVVNLPAGIAPGTHTVTLTAIGSDGSTLSLVTTFVVSSSGTFTSISAGVGTVVGGLAATGPNTSALTLGLGSSAVLLALGVAVFALSRRNALRIS